MAYILCSRGDNNAQWRSPPGSISAPLTITFTGRVLYEFVCASGANLNDGTFEILSNPLASCLVNHCSTTNCLPSESIKKAMHLPKYTFVVVRLPSPSSSIITLTQSCAAIPWNRGIARKKTVCWSCKSGIVIVSWVATITGSFHCNIFVLLAFVILLKMALFASCEIHVGKLSHVGILR